MILNNKWPIFESANEDKCQNSGNSCVRKCPVNSKQDVRLRNYQKNKQEFPFLIKTSKTQKLSKYHQKNQGQIESRNNP